MSKNISDMLMVGYDHKEGDKPTLVIGRADPNTKEVDILNVFKGDEAFNLYKKLTVPSTIEEGNDVKSNT